MVTALAHDDPFWNDAFLAIVCNDPELLAAEFAAIITPELRDHPEARSTPRHSERSTTDPRNHSANPLNR